MSTSTIADLAAGLAAPQSTIMAQAAAPAVKKASNGVSVADLSIPAALDRTAGMTKEQVDAQRDKLIKKNAGLVAPKMRPAAGQPKKAIAEADKKAIAELKKMGADKASTVKRHGAQLKSEKMGTKIAKAKAKAAPKRKGNGKSKTALIANMLQRKGGCTAAEVLKACNWPSVSMPAQARAAKLKLRKEKEPGKPTRYFAA